MPTTPHASLMRSATLGWTLVVSLVSRLARHQGMAVSADTLLRLARRESPVLPPTPRHFGIDDFALRKGQRYGTICVALATHRPVHLKPEHSARVVEEWLKEHSGVEVMTRDRSYEYAEGASRGAPDAVQVADRFHLLQNGREMVQRVLDRHQAALQAATREPSPISPPPSAGAGASKLDPFTPYLEQQLATCADNALQLWRDRRDQGYTGSRALVSRWVAQHRQLIPIQEAREPSKRRQGRPHNRREGSASTAPTPSLGLQGSLAVGLPWTPGQDVGVRAWGQRLGLPLLKRYAALKLTESTTPTEFVDQPDAFVQSKVQGAMVRGNDILHNSLA